MLQIENIFGERKKDSDFYIQVLDFILVRPARFERTAFSSGG